MNKKPNLIIVSLLILLLIMLSACQVRGIETSKNGNVQTKQLYIGDGGFLSSKPCGPPCFLSVLPGITSYKELNIILTTNEVIETCQEFNSGGVNGISCGDNLVFNFDDERQLVTDLGFIPDSEITIEDVVNKFGDPDSLTIYTDGYSKIISSMHINYSKYKMVLSLEDQNGDSYHVQPETRISNIGYCNEEIFQMLTQDTQTWSGYRIYYLQ